MKKFETKEINYNGCDADIMHALREGNTVRCGVSDSGVPTSESPVVWIIGYAHASHYPYTDENGAKWIYAKPIPLKEKRVKKASEIMKWLEDNGYEADSCGDWDPPKEDRMGFSVEMWQFCGKEPDDEWSWLPEWLEEI